MTWSSSPSSHLSLWQYIKHLLRVEPRKMPRTADGRQAAAAAGSSSHTQLPHTRAHASTHTSTQELTLARTSTHESTPLATARPTLTSYLSRSGRYVQENRPTTPTSSCSVIWTESPRRRRARHLPPLRSTRVVVKIRHHRTFPILPLDSSAVLEVSACFLLLLQLPDPRSMLEIEMPIK